MAEKGETVPKQDPEIVDQKTEMPHGGAKPKVLKTVESENPFVTLAKVDKNAYHIYRQRCAYGGQITKVCNNIKNVSAASDTTLEFWLSNLMSARDRFLEKQTECIKALEPHFDCFDIVLNESDLYDERVSKKLQKIKDEIESRGLSFALPQSVSFVSKSKEHVQDDVVHDNPETGNAGSVTQSGHTEIGTGQVDTAAQNSNVNILPIPNVDVISDDESDCDDAVSHSSPKHNSSVNSVTKLTNELVAKMPEGVDEFIDCLNPFEETQCWRKYAKKYPKSNFVNHELPKMSLRSYNGDPLQWVAFIETFRDKVHYAPISDSKRHEILQSLLTGKARETVSGLGTSASYYVTCLKELKLHFSQRMHIVNAFIASICEGSVFAADADSVRRFYTLLRDCTTTLTRLGYANELNAGYNLLRATKRIPYELRYDWNKYVAEVSINATPTLMHLQKWLEIQLRAAITPFAQPSVTPAKHKQNQHTGFKQNGTTYNGVNKQSKPINRKCPHCNGDHPLYFCGTFKGLSLDQRTKFVKDNSLCFNCLGPGHQTRECRSSHVCRRPNCGKKHNYLLHRDKQSKHTNVDAVECKSENSIATDNHTNTTCGNEINTTAQQLNTRIHSDQTYFQVVKVCVISNSGKSAVAGAIIDSASDVSFINEKLASKLGICGPTGHLSLNTMSGTSKEPSQRVSFHVCAYNDPDAMPIVVHKAWTTTKQFQCPVYDSESIPNAYKPNEVTIERIDSHDILVLLGADVPLAHFQERFIPATNVSPAYVKTPLGWSLFGRTVSGCIDENCIHNSLFIETQGGDLDVKLDKFFVLENEGVSSKKSLSQQDKVDFDVLANNVHFNGCHYESPLLRASKDSLPNNYSLALSRFILLSKKFNRDTNYYDEYAQAMNTYLKEGYAMKLTDEEANVVTDKTYYLPHFGVRHPQKQKLRIVFDAAAKYKGFSLNDQLSKGPDLISSLVDILVRFRTKQVSVTGDISAMFSQVKVLPSDTDSLRFLWAPKNSLNKPDTYKMVTHVFGAACSPAVANYCLQRAAIDSPEYPETVRQAVSNSFYVDDYLASFNTEKEALNVTVQLTNMLSNKGFTLTKFQSSSLHVREALSSSQSSEEHGLGSPEHSTLGIKWNTITDTFRFTTIPKVAETLTKRSIVSAMSQIYDPLGFIQPYILVSKLIVQKLWVAGLEWDTPVDLNIKREWESWLAQLAVLEQITIPRYVGVPPNHSAELHVFADASHHALGAVAYLRSLKPDGTYNISLVQSKSKVKPSKVDSIPRLELIAALMASRLKNSLIQSLDIPISSSVLYTDSETVLKYLHNSLRRWHIFVANRVNEILQHTTLSEWRYISTQHNPADILSRGSTLEFLLQSDWFTPKALQDQCPGVVKDKITTCSSDVDLRPDSTLSYLGNANKTKHTCMTIQQTNKKIPLSSLVGLHKHSNWLRVLHIVSYLLRAKMKFLALIGKNDSNLPNAGLTLPEIEAAEQLLIIDAQEVEFGVERQCASNLRSVPMQSKLKNLSPVYDLETNMLRLSGRTTHAKHVPSQSQHQIILPQKHDITRLIITHIHLKCHHAGPEYIVAKLREKYWPLNARVAVRSILHKCMMCKIIRAKPVVVKMANLPPERVDIRSKVFNCSGVDFFGPYMLKQGRKSVKVWGAIVTCLTTRAVYLDVAEGYDTDQYILLLRRFLALYGPIKVMYSDCQAAFLAANRELSEAIGNIENSAVLEFALQAQFEFKFITPYSPSKGGAIVVI